MEDLSLSLSLKRATTTTTSWSSFGFVLSHPLEGKGPTRFLVSSRPPSSLGRERREGPAFLLFRKAISVHSSDSLSLPPFARPPASAGKDRREMRTESFYPFQQFEGEEGEESALTFLQSRRNPLRHCVTNGQHMECLHSLR